jgi:hypothetical protein
VQRDKAEEVDVAAGGCIGKARLRSHWLGVTSRIASQDVRKREIAVIKAQGNRALAIHSMRHTHTHTHTHTECMKEE